MTNLVNPCYTKEEYKKLLEFSYKVESECGDCKESRFDFLDKAIFDLTTYDSGISDFLVRRIVNVCEAINNKTTFEYIENEENYLWYITVLNFNFFNNKLSWGTSIRGAWWEFEIEIKSTGLWLSKEDKDYKDDEKDGRWNQIRSIKFKENDFIVFTKAVIEFSRED